MSDDLIDRLRSPNFAHAVRGYDRHEVDRFLAEVADWVEDGAGDEVTTPPARDALGQVGERISVLLTEAHDAAEAIRADAAAEVRQKLIDANATAERLAAEAEREAEKMRTEADDYARKTRTGADAYAEDATASFADARANAKRMSEEILEKANRRKAKLEAVIADLEERRDQTIAELETIASGLTGAASKTRSKIDTGDDEAGVDAGVEMSAADEPTRRVAVAPGRSEQSL